MEEITRDEFVRNYAAYVVPKNRKASSSVPSKKVSPSRYLFKNITMRLLLPAKGRQ